MNAYYIIIVIRRECVFKRCPMLINLIKSLTRTYKRITLITKNGNKTYGIPIRFQGDNLHILFIRRFGSVTGFRN